jgi:hypothetical protein
MFRKWAALAALGSFCAIGFAQVSPPNYKIENGVATWITSAYSLDEVKAAIPKALGLMNWKIMGPTPSGSGVFATANLSPDFDSSKRPHAIIGAVVNGGNPAICATWYIGNDSDRRSPEQGAKGFFDELFTKIVEALK